jgi:hypothetical protein
VQLDNPIFFIVQHQSRKTRKPKKLFLSSLLKNNQHKKCDSNSGRFFIIVYLNNPHFNLNLSLFIKTLIS